MATTLVRAETYLPGEPAAVDAVADLLGHAAAAAHRPRRCYLVLEGTDERIVLPAEMFDVLRQVAETMRRGLAATVAPVSQQLTTQQAADILGISRPTFVKLLEAGKVPYERVGSHRRVRLADVLAYRERRRAAQYAMLEATAVDPGEDESLDDLLARLRRARHDVARQVAKGQ